MAAAAMSRSYRETVATRAMAKPNMAIAGLADYVRSQCSTPQSRDAYLSRMGLYRKASGSLDVRPL